MRFGRREVLAILGFAVAASIVIYFEMPQEQMAGMLEFTDAEAAWIATNPVIRLAYDPNWPPIEYIDDAGKLAGISASYQNLLEDSTGLDFEIVPTRDWSHALEHLQEGRADVILAAAQTDERLAYMGFTEPHIVMSWDMISLQDEQIESLESFSVATMKDYEVEEWLDANMPNVSYTSHTTHESAFAALESGEADVFIEVWPVVSYLAEKRGTVLYNAGSVGHNVELSVAFAADKPLLGDILQKGLDAISPDQRAHILTFT